MVRVATSVKSLIVACLKVCRDIVKGGEHISAYSYNSTHILRLPQCSCQGNFVKRQLFNCTVISYQHLLTESIQAGYGISLIASFRDYAHNGIDR